MASLFLLDIACQWLCIMDITNSSGFPQEEAMGTIGKRFLRKRHLLSLAVAIVWVGLSVSYSDGEETKKVKYGLSAFGGAGDAWHNKADFGVYGVLPRVDFRLHKYCDQALRWLTVLARQQQL